MKQAKLLFVIIILALGYVSSYAQIENYYSFNKSIERHEFTNLPFYARWGMLYENVTSFHSEEFFDIYTDFQRSKRVGNDRIPNTDVVTKIRCPGSRNLLVGVIDSDGEYRTIKLCIVDKNNYSIKDSMYGSFESSSGASKQYTVKEIRENRMNKLIVKVYKFFPESSSSVDIEEFRFTPNASIMGRIEVKEYEVANVFILRSTHVSPRITIHSSDFARNFQLWSLYDYNDDEGNGSDPNPPIDDKPGPTPPREEH